MTATVTRGHDHADVDAMRLYGTGQLVNIVLWCRDVLAGVKSAGSGTLTIRALHDLCDQELTERGMAMARGAREQ